MDAILNWHSRHQAFVFQSNEYRDLIILYTAITDLFLVQNFKSRISCCAVTMMMIYLADAKLCEITKFKTMRAQNVFLCMHPNQKSEAINCLSVQ